MSASHQAQSLRLNHPIVIETMMALKTRKRGPTTPAIGERTAYAGLFNAQTLSSIVPLHTRVMPARAAMQAANTQKMAIPAMIFEDVDSARNRERRVLAPIFNTCEPRHGKTSVNFSTRRWPRKKYIFFHCRDGAWRTLRKHSLFATDIVATQLACPARAPLSRSKNRSRCPTGTPSQTNARGSYSFRKSVLRK